MQVASGARWLEPLLRSFEPGRQGGIQMLHFRLFTAWEAIARPAWRDVQGPNLRADEHCNLGQWQPPAFAIIKVYNHEDPQMWPKEFPTIGFFFSFQLHPWWLL